MNLSSIFIRRPVATTLLMAGILIFGGLAYRQLPVADLPSVDFPTIRVQAALPGASPETMASSVALPLEKQFSAIAGLTSMNSTSTQGGTEITLQFDLSRDIDSAAADVQAMIGRASRQLPGEMPAPPSYQKVNPADNAIFFIVMRSSTLSLTQLDELAQSNVAQRISMVSGVAQVNIFGSQKYAVRIDLDPRQLAARGIGIDEVASSVQSANVNMPTGTMFGNRTFVVTTNGQLMSAAAYGPAIIAYRGGYPVRLDEVAHVYDGAENDRSASWQNGERCIYLSVQKQPGTNVVQIVDAIKALLPGIEAQLPASVKLDIRSDRSATIRESVHDVKLTLVATVALVILVIFIFLRNVSATLIPSLALPGSIVGTFAVMYLLGFSLDNLSLMALTLSVGFVVDDAIVMLENIVRHMEMGKPPMQAALDGSKEIAFTIVSMTASLVAVFIPVFFMSGVVGRLLHEFAITIGAAILISGFVSLSLTPMMASRFLRPPHTTRHGWLYNAFERVFDGCRNFYGVTLTACLRFRAVTMVLSLVLLGVTVYLFTIVPKGFLPNEDQGRFVINTEAAESISFNDMVRHQRQLAAIVEAEPDIASVADNVGLVGNNATGGTNTGRMFIELTPRAERTRSVEQVIASLRPKLAQVPGIRAFPVNPPPINLGGGGNRPIYQFTLQDADTAELYRSVPLLEERVRQIPGLEDVSSDLKLATPQVTVEMDRDKLSTLGLSAEQVEDALRNSYARPAGDADLRREQSVSGGDARGARVPERSGSDVTAARPLQHRPADSARIGGAHADDRRAVPGESLRPAAVREHLVQPGAGRRAGRRGCADRACGGRDAASDRVADVPGSGPGVPGFAARARPRPADGHRRDLHRAGRALRELHPPVDDSLRPARCRSRRAADAAHLRRGPEPLCVRRRDHAGRAGEEERHHDGGLRRGRAAPGQDRGRGDPRGVPRPLPADHDDDNGGAGGDAADRTRPRRRRRVTPPARPRGGRRTPRVAAPDAVHHPRVLRVHRGSPRETHSPQGCQARVPAHSCVDLNSASLKA